MANKWGNNGTSDRLYFLQLQNHCKWRLQPWNLESILKSRNIILPTKIHLVKVMVFPVVVYGRESWTIKKAERQRINVFELWCWRRLKSPWDCEEINTVNPKVYQSWIFIGRTDVEAETPIIWSPNVQNWFLGKDSHPWKDWRWKEKGMQRMRLLDGVINSMDMSFKSALRVGDGQGSGMMQSMGLQRVRHDWMTELNWSNYQLSF